MTDLKQRTKDQLRAKLTQIVRRHRDDVVEFDLDHPIYDSRSGLDSLDLAEAFAWIEQVFGIDPMKVREWSVSTWEEFVDRACAEGR